ncbi:MAG TPA: sulfatase-like hydrolase/transferase [Bacteroidales bacterium]|nr:sulfatase-like hydrolase/transferase [Bacteroidales bacterium]
MNSYIRQVYNVLYKIAIVLGLFTISRIFFLIFNYGTFAGNSFGDFLAIFIAGARFDFSAVIYINLLFIVLYLLPFKFGTNRYYLKVLNILFYTVNALALLLNFIDIEYFKFIGKRSTADLFSFVFMSDDVNNLLPQFLHDYWYIPLLWAVTVALGIFKMKRNPFLVETYPFKNWVSYIYATLILVITCGLLFAGARGLKLKPVRIITAAKYTESKNLPLLLNTPFCIIQTVSEQDIAERAYFKPEELESIYSPVQQLKPAKVRTDNVVIVILESFSREFIGSLMHSKGYTPNFDSIAKQGLIFENAFANGKRSIDALPAIFSSIPGLTDNPYISSQYSGNAMDALPSILSHNGYNTSFFHGGRNGTMGFDEYSRLAGIKSYYGMNEYKGPEAYDGRWGIFDVEFLNFYADQLSTFKQPFFSGIFTLSSHHPYKVPEKYESKFPKTESNLYRTIRYADFALGQFFQKASKMEWFKHTLFVLVADHTARDERNAEDISLDMFRIPIVFYHPGDTTLKGHSARIVQQTDIMPSILDYLGYSKPFVSFGKSIFSNDPSFAVYYLSGLYKFVKGDYLLTFDGEHSISLQSTKEKNAANIIQKNPEIAHTMEKELKAIIQQYYTRLKENRLVVR